VRRLRACALAVLTLAGPAASVSAQPADNWRIEVAGGGRFIGPIGFAGVAANESTLGGGSRALFDSRTTLDRSLGEIATIGVRLSRMLRAEGTFGFNRTTLSTRITSDAEGVSDVTITAPVTQLLIEGGVLAQPAPWRMGRASPFITAGLGYVRQLNDGRTLVETGQSMYVGAGLYYVRASSRPRRLKATGLRADVRAQIMRDGVAPDSDAHPALAVAATAFVRF
jgi:opacity protein-like surface antigen